MASSVKIVDHSAAWAKAQGVNLNNAVYSMAEAINKLAEVKAPVLTGALRSDGRVEGSNGKLRVVYGDARVPYARRRHFENNKNPQTKYYLQDAGDTIVKRGLGVYL